MPHRYLKRLPEATCFHVFNRGANKKTIFFNSTDYQRFIDRLQIYCKEASVDLLTYCLMRNHYHLLLRENDLGSIAIMMQRLNCSHAKYFNIKYGQTGHLLEGPYGERSIENDEDLINVSAYIHNNPKDLGVNVETYRWSSLPNYLSGQTSWIDNDTILNYFPEANKIDVYHEYVLSCQSQALPPQPKPGFEMVTL